MHNMTYYISEYGQRNEYLKNTHIKDLLKGIPQSTRSQRSQLPCPRIQSITHYNDFNINDEVKRRYYKRLSNLIYVYNIHI